MKASREMGQQLKGDVWERAVIFYLLSMMDNRARFSADGLLWQTVFEMHRDVMSKNKLLQKWSWVKEGLFMHKSSLCG